MAHPIRNAAVAIFSLLVLLAACGRDEPAPPGAADAGVAGAQAEPAPKTAAPEAVSRLTPEKEEQARRLIGMLGNSDLEAGFQAARGLVELGPAVIPLVGPLILNGDDMPRWHAVRILGEVGTRRAMRYLHDGLKDAWVSVRIASTESLARVMQPDDEVSTTELISILLNDTEPIVKAYAARGLIEIGNLMGVPTLVANLKAKLWARETSLETLRKISGQDFGLDVYASESRRREGIAGWEAWYRSHRPLHDNLIGYLGVYKFLFAETAKSMLVDLGSDAAPAVIEALGDANEHVRAHCAEILGLNGERAAVPGLVERLVDPVSVVRLKAAIALGKIADPDAIPALGTASVSDADRDVRLSSVVALGRIAAPGTVAALEHVAMRSDESVEIRDVARLFLLFGPASAAFKCESALTLQRRGNPLGIPMLVIQLRGAPADRKRAADRLGETFGETFGFDPGTDPAGQAEALEKWDRWCGKLIRDHGATIRDRLDVMKLVHTQAPDRALVGKWARYSVGALVSLLDDDDSTEHHQFLTCELLGLIADRSASPALGKTLGEDPSIMVREAAGHALAKVADPRSARDLEAALDDPERYVRLASVKALATAGDPDSIAPLIRARQANILDSEIVSEIDKSVKAIQGR